MSEERRSRLDLGVEALRNATACMDHHLCEIMGDKRPCAETVHDKAVEHLGCDACCALALLAALRVVMAEPSANAVEQLVRRKGSARGQLAEQVACRSRLVCAFAADLAELETEARRG